MADLRLPYSVDNPVGAVIAKVAQATLEAKHLTDQALALLTCIGEDVDIETALGMAHDLLYSYHLKGLLNTQKTALDSLCTDIPKIDKGL